MGHSAMAPNGNAQKGMSKIGLGPFVQSYPVADSDYISVSFVKNPLLFGGLDKEFRVHILDLVRVLS